MPSLGLLDTPLKLPPITCCRRGGAFKSNSPVGGVGRAVFELTLVRPDSAVSISEREGAFGSLVIESVCPRLCSWFFPVELEPVLVRDAFDIDVEYKCDFYR